MEWLVFIIFAYLLFAVASLVDKHILAHAKVNHETISFYLGVLGILVIVLIPFVGFAISSFSQLFLSLGAGFFLTYSLYFFFKGLQLFEASRFVPLVGALVPLFTFLFVFVLAPQDALFTIPEFVSFVLLLGGIVLISHKQGKKFNKIIIIDAFLSALLLSVSFVMAKYVYISSPFWTGFILMRFGGVLFALALFILFKRLRAELFSKKDSFKNPRTAFTFLLGQIAGGLGEILRNAAIFLVPLSMLPFIHALQGIEYVFLFLLASMLSSWNPRIIKEELSQKAMVQKIMAIACIVIGLAILAFV